MFNETQQAIAGISDTLQRHSFALHTFVSLLTSSNLEEFAGDDLPDTYIDLNIEKHDLRQGLGYLLELYLVHQQKLLNEYMDSSHKGNSWFINKARNIVSQEESDSYSSNEVAVNELMIAIAVLDIVINNKASTKDGCTKEAEELKATCLQRIAELKES